MNIDPRRLEAATDGNLADRVYAHIMKELAEGRMKSGGAIQESRIADMLGLSRTPVRDALGRLEGEGLLIREGRLLSVRRMTIKEFLDLLYVRRLIEPEAAWLACGSVNPRLLRDLRDRLGSDPGDAAGPDWDLDEAIHLAIVDALDNHALAELVRSLRRRTLLFEFSELPGEEISGHAVLVRFVQALIDKDRNGAKLAMTDHLEDLREKIVSHVRSL